MQGDLVDDESSITSLLGGSYSMVALEQLKRFYFINWHLRRFPFYGIVHATRFRSRIECLCCSRLLNMVGVSFSFFVPTQLTLCLIHHHSICPPIYSVVWLGDGWRFSSTTRQSTFSAGTENAWQTRASLASVRWRTRLSARSLGNASGFGLPGYRCSKISDKISWQSNAFWVADVVAMWQNLDGGTRSDLVPRYLKEA